MYIDDFHQGEAYKELKECIHISILAYPLFESDSFYSVIRLMDESSHRIYSGKISLRVLQLTKLDQATKEERQTDLYKWARMIVTDDWSEQMIMAKDNPYMKAAVDEIGKINADKAMRYAYLLSEMKASDEATLRLFYEEKDRQFEESQKKLEERQKDLEKSQKDLEKSQKDLEKSQKDLEESQKVLEKRRKVLEERQKDLEVTKKQWERTRQVMKLLLKGYTEEQVASLVGISVEWVRKIKGEDDDD